MDEISRRWVIEHGLLAGLSLLLVPVGAWSRSRNHGVERSGGPTEASKTFKPGPQVETRGKSETLERDASPPWAALAPYTKGAALPLGWRLASLTPVYAGSALLTLSHSSGRQAVVRLARRGSVPIGIAQTRDLDILLVNGAKGQTQTDELLGRVVLTLAAVIRSHERVFQAADHHLGTLNPAHC